MPSPFPGMDPILSRRELLALPVDEEVREWAAVLEFLRARVPLP